MCLTFSKSDIANLFATHSFPQNARLLRNVMKLDWTVHKHMLKMMEKMNNGGLDFVGSKRYEKFENSIQFFY